MEVVKIKCFLVCQVVLSDPLKWGRQTSANTEADRVAELESFSCWPADVPHPHVLMAFYGSLESLWLLLTQWDSLQRQRGLQKQNLLTSKRDIVLLLGIFNLWSDFIWNISVFDPLLPWIVVLPLFEILCTDFVARGTMLRGCGKLIWHFVPDFLCKHYGNTFILSIIVTVNQQEIM